MPNSMASMTASSSSRVALMLTSWFMAISLRMQVVGLDADRLGEARTVIGGSISAWDLRVGARRRPLAAAGLLAAGAGPPRLLLVGSSRAAAGTGEVTPALGGALAPPGAAAGAVGGRAEAARPSLPFFLVVDRRAGEAGGGGHAGPASGRRMAGPPGGGGPVPWRAGPGLGPGPRRLAGTGTWPAPGPGAAPEESAASGTWPERHQGHISSGVIASRGAGSWPRRAGRRCAAGHPGAAGDGSARPRWARAGWSASGARDHAAAVGPDLPAGRRRRRRTRQSTAARPAGHGADSRRGHVVAPLERLEAGVRRPEDAGGWARVWPCARPGCTAGRRAARPRAAARASSTMGRVRRERSRGRLPEEPAARPRGEAAAEAVGAAAEPAVGAMAAGPGAGGASHGDEPGINRWRRGAPRRSRDRRGRGRRRAGRRAGGGLGSVGAERAGPSAGDGPAGLGPARRVRRRDRRRAGLGGRRGLGRRTGGRRGTLGFISGRRLFHQSPDPVHHRRVEARQGTDLDVESPLLNAVQQLLTLQAQLFGQLVNAHRQRQLLPDVSSGLPGWTRPGSNSGCSG